MTTYFNHNSLTVGRVNPYDQPDHKKTVSFYDFPKLCEAFADHSTVFSVSRTYCTVRSRQWSNVNSKP